MSVRSGVQSISTAFRIAVVVVAAAVLSAASPARGTDAASSLGVTGRIERESFDSRARKVRGSGMGCGVRVGRNGHLRGGQSRRGPHVRRTEAGDQKRGDVRVSGEQPPRVALLPRSGRDPALVVVWTEKEAVGTRLLWSRSDDSGASFLRRKALPAPRCPETVVGKRSRPTATAAWWQSGSTIEKSGRARRPRCTTTVRRMAVTRRQGTRSPRRNTRSCTSLGWTAPVKRQR